MMKYFFALLFILLIEKLSFAQFFNKRFSIENRATLQQSVVSIGGFNYLIGSNYNPLYVAGLKIYVIKSNSQGGFLDSVFTTISGGVQVFSESNVIVENEGSLIFTGTASMINGTSKMLLVKMDTNLNTLFQKEYEWAGLRYFQGKHITVDKDRGYLITGHIQYSNYDLDYFLLKTDSAGNELWRQSYGVSNLWDWGYNVLVLPNGNILLSGYSENGNPVGGLVYPRTCLIETDSLGNQLWEWRDPDSSTVLNSLIPTQDGGFVGVGSYITFRSQWDGFKRKGYWVKFDLNKQKVGEQVYGFQTGHSRFNDVVELPDGNFLVCGALGIDPSEQYNRHGNICKLTPNGDTIWCKSYIGVNSAPQCCSDNMLYDLEVLPDGSIMASGQADDNTGVNPPPNQQGWLLHIDSNGCLLPGSCGVTAVEEVPLSFGEGLGVRLYPNPAHNTLNIQLQNFNHLPNSIQILNINGQMLLQQSISSDEMQIDVITLPQGLYVVQVMDGSLVVQYKKFIKD